MDHGGVEVAPSSNTQSFGIQPCVHNPIRDYCFDVQGRSCNVCFVLYSCVGAVAVTVVCGLAVLTCQELIQWPDCSVGALWAGNQTLPSLSHCRASVRTTRSRVLFWMWCRACAYAHIFKTVMWSKLNMDYVIDVQQKSQTATLQVLQIQISLSWLYWRAAQF